MLKTHPDSAMREHRLTLSRLRQAWRKINDALEQLSKEGTTLTELDKDAPLPAPQQKELRQSWWDRYHFTVWLFVQPADGLSRLV